MKTCASARPSRRYSRRQFLCRSAGATALFGLAALGSKYYLGNALAEESYTGDLVILSQLGAAPDKALPKLLEAFKAANSGINTKVVLYPEEKFVALYTAAQAAGEQIDVLMLNGQDIRRYATSGALIPFDDITYKSRFIPEALVPYTIGGQLWGVPAGAAGGFPIYVNMALLKKYQLAQPKTYDELKQIGKVLDGHGLKAFTHPGKVIYMWPVWFFTTFAQTTENKPIERTTQILTGKGKFTDSDVVQAIDLVFQFSRDKLFIPGMFSLDFPNALNEFTTGKCAFYLFHDSVAKQVMEANPPDMELDVMLMPNLVGKQVESQFPGGPGLVVSIPVKIDPKRKDVAWKLVDFLTTDSSDAESVKLNGGAVPVNVNVSPADIPVYIKEKGFIDKMVTYLDWFWPPEITHGFQEGLQAGLAGRITADELAKNIQATFERLVSSGYSFKG
jgi:raffinose/stachyose/melibiose transport system substrate-binding protein